MEEVSPNHILNSFETLYILGHSYEANPENVVSVNKKIIR
jgi:hypothetical protein